MRVSYVKILIKWACYSVLVHAILHCWVAYTYSLNRLLCLCSKHRAPNFRFFSVSSVQFPPFPSLSSHVIWLEKKKKNYSCWLRSRRSEIDSQSTYVSMYLLTYNSQGTCFLSLFLEENENENVLITAFCTVLCSHHVCISGPFLFTSIHLSSFGPLKDYFDCDTQPSDIQSAWQFELVLIMS